MEYHLFDNFIPIGTLNGQPLNFHGYDTPPSDSSMDTDIRESMKLKDAQVEEFFHWSNEMKTTIDQDRNPYGLNDTNLCSEDTNNKSNQQCKEYQSCEMQTKTLDGYPKLRFSKGVSMKDKFGYEKDEEDECLKIDMVSKIEKQRKPGDNACKAEMDMYLDKAHLKVSKSLGCVLDNQDSIPSAGVPRKRKLDTGWQQNKIRPQREMMNGRIWPVDDLEIDLSNDLSNPGYSMSDALLSLSAFKQEAPSPTNATGEQSSPIRGVQWSARQQMIINNNNNANCGADQNSLNQMNNNNNGNHQGLSNNGSQNNNQMVIHSSNNAMATSQGMPIVPSVVSYTNGLPDNMNSSSPGHNQNVIDVANGLLISHAPIDSYQNCGMKSTVPQMDNDFNFDNRFQYILAAATSIATKCNEDTLTYLNQCQSYEIKLKKVGDLTHYRGKILKTIIRICFHERRLQYAEREQMSLWQNERPGERIVEVDVPLSYGLLYISQPTEQPLLNTVELYWDPVKEAGVYIKINCISTEFTAKKHGGEKGVPFRIQVETFLPGEGIPGTVSRIANQPPMPDKRLHAAACQIKVFKLKGADRKHKQDKEKIMRRPPSERDKYQPSYDCTMFTDLPNDAVFSTPPVITQPYSPENCGLPVRPSASSSVSPPRMMETSVHTPVLQTPLNEMKFPQRLSRTDSHGSSLECEDETTGRQVMQCMPASPDREIDILTETSTPIETRAWLSNHRFLGNAQTFGNFSGSDILRLSREDLIQICGLADGIRLYNALHAERAPARITLYIKKSAEQQFNAIYLRNCHVNELKRKIQMLINDGSLGALGDIYVSGPNGIKIRLTDEVIQNFKNDSMFRLEPTEGGVIMISF